MLRNRTAQSTLEYAVIIAVVVAALLAIQIYMKRGVQGKLRESIDQVGEQYSAGNMTSKVTTQQTGNLQTVERFGMSDDSGTFKQGVSRYEVKTPAPTTRKATGADKETITKDATTASEPLF